MFSSRFFSRTLLMLSLVLFATSETRGQDDYLARIGVPPSTTAVPVEHGFINLATGDLHIEIPLGSFPQRGGRSYGAKIVYDSSIWWPANGWSPTNVARSQSVRDWYGGNGGWRLVTSSDTGRVNYNDKPIRSCRNDSSITQDTFKDFSWIEPDGTAHNFRTKSPWQVTGAYTTTSTNCMHTGYWLGVPADAVSDDGLGYHIFVTAGCLQPGCWPNVAVYAPDGTRVSSLQPLSAQDSNGNYYPFSHYVDSLSRTVVTTSQSGNLTYHDVLNSQGGTSRYTVQTQQISVNTAFGTSMSEYSGTLPVIQSITLPDGTAYTFNYDAGATSGHYGLLTSMTLPTGGVVNFGYSNFTDPYSQTARWATSRSTSDGTWNYTPQIVASCSGSFSCNQVTVTKPSGDSAVYTFLPFPRGQGTWPITIQYYNGAPSGSNLLATANECWSFSTFTNGVCSAWTGLDSFYTHKIASSTTLPIPGGTTLNQTTQFAWDTTNYGNLVQRSEWNFYSGSLPAVADRTTTHSYLNSSPYLAANIVNRPTAVTVTDKNGNTVSQTLYTYDGSALTTVSGVANHDDTNYGSSNTVRGNLTQVQKLVSGTSNFVTTSKSYDTTGQITTSTDGNGNVTTYSYADNFFNDGGDTSNPVPYTPPTPTNAYLKSITRGPLTNTFGYYWGTGQKAVSIDPNNQTTYFHYFDPLSRPTSTKMPDSGWTFTQYSSTGTQIDTGTGITSTTLTTNCLVSSNACRHNQTLLDGFGRVTSSILVSDPDGAATTATAYDSNGRVLKTSNPYRSISDTTYGWTVKTYDGLNRTTQVQRQDGSLFRTFYGSQVGGGGGTTPQLCSSFSYGLGYPALTVDEAGKKRQTWTDGFGRVMEVDEPDSTGSLTVGTCYSYDLNNNLIAVLQNGSRQRTFTYNSLSQLLTATNPESGTIGYTYDANGNLTYKTGPAPNQTGTATVTLTYCYDVLNRLTAKSYTQQTCTNGIMPTPVATYSYDQTNCLSQPSCSNVGRRTGMTDAAGSELWAYDSMGRLLSDQRTTNGVTKSTVYTYLLDGSANIVTYPSGRAMSFTTGSAQRSLSVQDNSTSVYYVTGAHYNPPGSLSSLTNGTSLISAIYYNSRLQPCRISVKSSGSAPANCGDTTNNGNVLDFTYGFNLGSADNGNVAFITNNRDNTRSQNFTYDSLNRISMAQTQTTGVTIPNPNCWGLTFGYDPWGNLLTASTTGPSGCSGPLPLNVAVTTANRISTNTLAGTTTNYCYDAAGNLVHTVTAPSTCPTSGPYQYTYDAENHMTSTSNVTYTYDGDGKRVQKSNGIIYWYGMGSDALDETDLSGSITNTSFKEYIFFGGKRIARRDSSNVVNYYFVDHLGTSRVATNSSGVACYDADFYPFGGERIVTDTCDSAYKFTGKERDSESGLDNFGARYNSSFLGRFLSPDPSSKRLAPQRNPQDWNLYSYGGNNPLQYIDPTGSTTELYTLGPREGNPFGHSSIRITNSKGDFVYSFDGNAKGKLILEKIPFAQYFHDAIRNKDGDAKFQDSGVFDEHPNRMVTGQILTWKTDGNQEKATQAYLEAQVAAQKNGQDLGDYNAMTNNCTTNAATALQAGGLPLIFPGVIEPGSLQRELETTGAVDRTEVIWNTTGMAPSHNMLEEEQRYDCYVRHGFGPGSSKACG